MTINSIDISEHDPATAYVLMRYKSFVNSIFSKQPTMVNHGQKL